jgi:hypothetical protein
MSAQSRTGDWMLTYTGKVFYPLDPRPEEIDLMDIGHALGNLCSYGGHSMLFYSVAEHSVLMSHHADTLEDAKVALMHDATEAYLSDVVRPIKKYLTNYNEIEAKLWTVIAQRFQLPVVISNSVQDLDNRIVWDEMTTLFKDPSLLWSIPKHPLNVKISCLAPLFATDVFMRRAMELGIG